MAGAYSADLRERVLMAVEAGEAPEEVAERFMVGRATAYRWVAAARDEGRRTAKPMNGGPKPIIRGELEAALVGLLGSSNPPTPEECRDRLGAAPGLWGGTWTG